MTVALPNNDVAEKCKKQEVKKTLELLMAMC